MSERNNWDVPYSCISFFEKTLTSHSKVQDFRRTSDIYFTILDTKSRMFNTVLVNEYVLGMAAVIQIKREFPEVEYIVTAGNWNGYTREAKEYGWENDIGVFNIGEFLGALYWSHPISYYKKGDRGQKEYAFKSS